jgi:hypothetical protein
MVSIIHSPEKPFDTAETIIFLRLARKKYRLSFEAL